MTTELVDLGYNPAVELDERDICYPGHPNDTQLRVMDDLVDEDPDCFVVDWDRRLQGPVIVLGDGTWLIVGPGGDQLQDGARV